MPVLPEWLRAGGAGFVYYSSDPSQDCYCNNIVNFAGKYPLKTFTLSFK